MNPDVTKTSLGARRILADGTVLADRYHVKRLLGVGGMGMVYLARDAQLDIDVALKVLRTGGPATEMRLERFRSELVLARQVSHRNVVRIHDIGQSADLYFITMDFVEGESLKQVLDRESKLDADRATSIAADLADALAEAHRTDIVHRDIKPANVMIGADRAFLTDFGIARSIGTDGLTRAGDLVGTLDYLSPEQARGDTIDGRADIYALGLLLYEMLTGQRPFSGETAEEVLAQRMLAAAPQLTAHSDDIPAGLRAILARCLAVDPADRYQDAAELAADLRSGRASRSYRKAAGVAALVLLVIVGGYGAWSLWFALETGAPSADSSSIPTVSIAVLPFEVSIDTGDLDSISHGLAELLGEHLSAGGAVRVVASRRVNHTLRDLRLRPDNLPDSDRALLADLLDTEYLVLGRLQQIGDSYHVEARLRRAATGDVVHRSSFDVTVAANVFSTIAPMALDLQENLNVTSSATTSPIPVADPAALHSFSTGVELLSQGNAVAAIEHLQAAVRAAPEFALAWDRLAQTLSALGRDHEAIAAAEAAVAALTGDGARTGAVLRARKDALVGDTDAAITQLEALLPGYPDDIEMLLMLAEIYGDAGRLDEAVATLQKVVAGSPDHPQAWYLLGKFSILRGDARIAVDDYLVKALVVQNRLDNTQGRADVLNALGIAHAQLGDSAVAAGYYDQALQLRMRIGDERGVAAVLANLARISLRDGHFDKAKQDLLAARDKLVEIGDRWTVANLENELGFLEETRGRFSAALGHYREALRIRDGLGDLRALAESYNNIGYIYFVLGEYDNAAIFIERSQETYAKTGNREGLMFAGQTSGILNAARGRYDEALKSLLASLQLSREIDAQHAEAVTEGYIAVARYLQGQYAAAHTSFDIVREKLATLGDDRGLAEFTLRHAEMMLDLGMVAAAGDAIRSAAELLASDDNAAVNALLLRIQGDHLVITGDRRNAAERFAAARHVAESSGDRVAILLARLSGAQILESGPRIAELQSVRGECVRLGHRQLTVATAVALADAYLSADRPGDAEQVLRELTGATHGRQPYNGDYRVFAMLADVLEAQNAAAESAWQSAAERLQRALDAQNDSQRQAFVQQPAVQRIAGKIGMEI